MLGWDHRSHEEPGLDAMADFALLLKSYAGDFEYAQRLVQSFNAHNPTGLTMYCVVPDADVPQFEALAGEHVVVLSEAPLEPLFTSEPIHGIRPGYINQEIVKLAFWELELADNYFCVDSDAVFIRDISESDFVAPDGNPYTVLVEDNELKVEPRYYREHWQSREAALRRIADEVGLDDPILRTCHGHQVFSAAVLRSFRDVFLFPREWTYLDALRIAPYEFSWYNFWLQATSVMPIHQREPLVKVFHNEGQHLEYILRGITTEDMARGFLALVVNSNYSRDLGLVSVDESKPQALSRYLSYGEAGSMLVAKARQSLRRLRTSAR